MSLVTILATKTTLCQQHLLSQQKALVMLSIYAVSATTCCYLDRRRTLTRRWPTVYCVRTLTGIWFLSAFNGAHFDCCAYIIHLTQYWILEYTFRLVSKRSRFFGTCLGADLRFEYGNRRHRCL